MIWLSLLSDHPRGCACDRLSGSLVIVKVLSENDIKHWGTRFIAALILAAPVGAVPKAAGAYLAAAE